MKENKCFRSFITYIGFLINRAKKFAYNILLIAQNSETKIGIITNLEEERALITKEREERSRSLS